MTDSERIISVLTAKIESIETQLGDVKAQLGDVKAHLREVTEVTMDTNKKVTAVSDKLLAPGELKDTTEVLPPSIASGY